MDTEGACVIVGLMIGGIFILYMGVMSLRGHFKGLYLIRGIPLAAPASVVYTFFPGGIGFLILAIALLISNDHIARIIIVSTSALGILCALVLMLWQPRWLRPWWLLWLEEKYPLLLETLLEEARQAGRAWETEIRTEEDLERWAEQTVAKYGTY